MTRSQSRTKLLTISEGDENEEEEVPEAVATNKHRFEKTRRNVKPNSKINSIKIIPVKSTATSDNIINAILPVTDKKKYCPEVYKFKTDKKDSSEYQIAIVFPECDKKGDKKGGKKPFYSRKGRRNKRSRKTRKRK